MRIIAFPLTTTRRHQGGVTLIEVLITMVVVAIGLLGFAALQTVTMKNNRTALYRSLATMYAYSALDCLRVTGVDATQCEAESLVELQGNLPSGNISISGSTVTIQWTEGSDTKSFSTETSI